MGLFFFPFAPWDHWVIPLGLLPERGNLFFSNLWDGLKTQKKGFLLGVEFESELHRIVSKGLGIPWRSQSRVLPCPGVSPGSITPMIWFSLQLLTPIPGTVLDQALGIHLW